MATTADLEAAGRIVGEEQARLDLDKDAGGHGSYPRGSAARTIVGITSQRPAGTPGHQANQVVFEKMRAFRDRLTTIPTVRHARVDPGLGQWDGGGEATWVTSYEGNGEAMRLLQEMGRTYDQDAILVMHVGEGTDPVRELTFDSALDTTAMARVNTTMSAHGFGGWTWFKANGQTTLRIAFVPKWPTDTIRTRNDFLHAMKRLDTVLQTTHPHTTGQEVAQTEPLEREHDYQQSASARVIRESVRSFERRTAERGAQARAELQSAVDRGDAIAAEIARRRLKPSRPAWSVATSQA